MAFANRVGNLLKKSLASSPSLFQSIRYMSSSQVFIGGLSYGTDDLSLKEAFANYGEVVDARVIIDRESGRSRGFGFVTFTSSEEASASISGMDGKFAELIMEDDEIVHDGRTLLTVIGDTFTPRGHSISVYITEKFKERQCSSGHTWRHVDQQTKNFYYDEFLKKYIWEPGHEAEFKATWSIYCQRQYKELMYKWRKKKTRPTHVPNEVWEAWQNIWTAEKWQQKSVTACKNRCTEVAGPGTGVTKHTAGSRSIVEHAIAMEDTLQRPSTSWEIFCSTHKKKDGTFVDTRSQLINDNMTARIAQASQPVLEGGEPRILGHDEINNMYLEVVGGSKKNSIYGLGSQAKVIFHDIMHTPKLKGRLSSSSEMLLMKENEQLKDRLTSLEQAMAEKDATMDEKVNAAGEVKVEATVEAAIQKAMADFISRLQVPRSFWNPNYALPNLSPPHGIDSQETQDPTAPGN